MIAVDITNATLKRLHQQPLAESVYDIPEPPPQEQNQLDDELASSCALSIDVEHIPDYIRRCINEDPINEDPINEDPPPEEGTTTSIINEIIQSVTPSDNIPTGSESAPRGSATEQNFAPIVPTDEVAPSSPTPSTSHVTLYDLFIQEKREQYLNLAIHSADAANISIDKPVIIAYYNTIMKCPDAREGSAETLAALTESIPMAVGVQIPQGGTLNGASTSTAGPPSTTNAAAHKPNIRNLMLPDGDATKTTPAKTTEMSGVFQSAGRKRFGKWPATKCATCNRKIIAPDMPEHAKLCQRATICDLCDKALATVYSMRRHRLSCKAKKK